jgi:hypothetical protein
MWQGSLQKKAGMLVSNDDFSHPSFANIPIVTGWGTPNFPKLVDAAMGK